MNLKTQLTTKIFIVLCFCLISISIFAQKESIIYIGANGKLTTIDHAIYMQKVNAKPSGAIIQTYSLNDSKWEKIDSERYKKMNDSTYQIKGSGKNIPTVAFRIFYQQPDKSWKFKNIVKNTVLMSGSAKSVMPLLLDGQVTEYYSGENKKSVSEYRNNELVSNQSWSVSGEKYIDNVFYSVDVYPTYTPGNKALHDHVMKGFKDASIDIASISGSIVIGFVVMENGFINGVKVLKGLGPTINSVAYESFKTLPGTWTPAKLNNQVVRYFQVFPINFISKDSHIEFVEMRNGILDFGH